MSWYSTAARANPDFLPITVLTVSSIYIKYKYTVIGIYSNAIRYMDFLVWLVWLVW